jgi:hypothetical protein
VYPPAEQFLHISTFSMPAYALNQGADEHAPEWDAVNGMMVSEPACVDFAVKRARFRGIALQMLTGMAVGRATAHTAPAAPLILVQIVIGTFFDRRRVLS